MNSTKSQRRVSSATPGTPSRANSARSSSTAVASRKKSQGTMTRKFRQNPVVAFINKSEVDVKLITAILNIMPREAIIKLLLFGFKIQNGDKISAALLRTVLYTIPKPVLVNIILFGYKSQGPDRQKQIFKMIQERQSIAN